MIIFSSLHFENREFCNSRIPYLMTMCHSIIDFEIYIICSYLVNSPDLVITLSVACILFCDVHMI